MALDILNEVRPVLVGHLKDGMSREEANRVTAEWMRASDNILSPYADEVVAALFVSDTEIEWRREFGDEFVDMWIEMKNQSPKTTGSWLRMRHPKK